MKKLLIATAFVFTTSSAFACLQFPCGMYPDNHPANQVWEDDVQADAQEYKPSKVSCTMKKIEKAKGQNSTTASVKASHEEYKSSNALDVGKYSYSFDVVYYEDNEEGDGVGVTFYENNSVQDEVGGFSCSIPLNKKVRGAICEDQISDFDGKVIFDFSCKVQY